MEIELKVNGRTVFYVEGRRKPRGNLVWGRVLRVLAFWVERDFYSFRFGGKEMLGGREHERYLRGEEV